MIWFTFCHCSPIQQQAAFEIVFVNSITNKNDNFSIQTVTCYRGKLDDQ